MRWLSSNLTMSAIGNGKVPERAVTDALSSHAVSSILGDSEAVLQLSISIASILESFERFRGSDDSSWS